MQASVAQQQYKLTSHAPQQQQQKQLLQKHMHIRTSFHLESIELKGRSSDEDEDDEVGGEEKEYDDISSVLINNNYNS